MKRFVLSMGLLVAMLAGCEQTTTQEPDSCSGITCSRHGVCIADPSGFHCQCDQGYAASGGECLPESPCSPNPCAAPHQTVCSSDGTSATCSCDEGYSKDADGLCVPFDPCRPNPCVEAHRTTCRAAGNAAVCSCDEGYWDYGACVPAVTCSPNPCTEPHRSVCSMDGATVACGCDPGYIEVDGRCIVDDPCDPNPCTGLLRTVCRAAGATAICSCDGGYREDALGNCVDACFPNPCLNPNQGVCVAAPGGFRCDCDEGYAMDFPTGSCLFDPPPDCTTAHGDGDSFEPNECPSLANLLVAPASVILSIDGAGDVDWFAVDSTGDRVYLLEATAASSYGLYLEISARGSDGVTPLGTSNGTYSSATRLAVSPAAGRFYVRVKSNGYSSGSNTGAYTLTLASTLDDYGNSPSAASTLSTAASLAGTIEHRSDEDWFVIAANAGVPVRLTIAGSSRISASLYDATVVSYPQASALASSADYSATSVVGWKPTTAGPLYLRVRSYDSDTPSYSVRVEEILSDDGNTPATASPIALGTSPSHALDYPDDLDWFTFAAPSNGIYTLTVQAPGSATAFLFPSSILTNYPASALASDDGSSATLSATLVGGQSYYVRVSPYYSTSLSNYTLTLAARGPDDHGNSATAATPLTVGQATAGSIQFSADQDWFSFRTSPGNIYEARLSATSLSVTLVGPDGTTTLQSTGYYSSSGPLLFGFWDEGPYFLSVRSNSGSSGDFSLVVDRIATDTAGNTPTLAAAVGTDTLIPGAIDHARDLDWYSLQLEKGRIYEFSLIPSSCPGTIKLYAADASTQLGTASSTSSNEAAVLRRAATSGAHYVQISAGDYSSNTGAYAFQVNDLGLDDHGDVATEATTVTAGTPQSGRVQFVGDVDWMSIPTAANHSYRVTVTPLGFSAQARLIDPNGYSVLEDQRSYLPIVFQFSAASAAPYFVNVSAALTNGIGSFTVGVEDLGQSR